MIGIEVCGPHSPRTLGRRVPQVLPGLEGPQLHDIRSRRKVKDQGTVQGCTFEGDLAKEGSRLHIPRQPGWQSE